MYEKNVRVLVHKSGAESTDSKLDRDIVRILRLAKNSKASCGFRKVKSGPGKCTTRHTVRSARRLSRLTVSAGCGSKV